MITAAAAFAVYGVGASSVLASTNDYHVLLMLQGVSLGILALVLLDRELGSSHGLATWVGILGASLAARLVTVAATRGSSANKAAKFRRWDALAAVLGYAVTMGYLLTSVVPKRSVPKYIGLTAVGIPSATAVFMSLASDSQDDLATYAELSSRVYAGYSLRSSLDTRVLFDTSEGDTLMVAFAGTTSKQNVKTDLKVADVAFAACGNRKTRVHAGFFKAWMSVRDQVLSRVAAHEGRVAFTGHSLGGALACLAALDIQCTTGKTSTVVTFGAPQVGDELFADAFNAKIETSIRVVNPLDPVPKSLSSQFTHTKGLYFVPGSLNPHRYAENVSKPKVVRLLHMALPLVFLLLFVLHK